MVSSFTILQSIHSSSTAVLKGMHREDSNLQQTYKGIELLFVEWICHRMQQLLSCDTAIEDDKSWIHNNHIQSTPIKYSHFPNQTF